MYKKKVFIKDSGNIKWSELAIYYSPTHIFEDHIWHDGYNVRKR